MSEPTDSLPMIPGDVLTAMLLAGAALAPSPGSPRSSGDARGHRSFPTGPEPLFPEINCCSAFEEV